LYFGEGQTGPMQFTRGNLAVRDYAENGEDVHVFRKVRDGYVRYMGQFVYAGARDPPGTAGPYFVCAGDQAIPNACW
jgi:5-methylcytosine-specific restriction protein A